MDNLEVSLELLSELTGFKPGKLSAAVKMDEENLKPADEIAGILKDAYKTKLEAVRKEARDEGHGRGKRESLSSYEKDLKAKFGVDGDDFDSILKATLDKVAKENGKGKAPEVTEELIKSHPYFNQVIDKEKEAYNKVMSDFDAYKSEVQTKETRNAVKRNVLSVLKESNFNLPSSERARDRILGVYVEDLIGDNKVEIADGQVKISTKDGTPIRDDSMNPLDFADYAKLKATDYFDVKKNHGGQSPGAQTPGSAANGGSGGENYAFPQVKNLQEFMGHYNTITDIKEKTAFHAHFKKIQEAGQVQ
jgi:hypothetical protein